MCAAPVQPEGNGSAVRRVLIAAGGVAAACWLFVWLGRPSTQPPAPRSWPWTAAGGSTLREERDYSWAVAAAGGAILTLVIQALWRWRRKRDAASDYDRTLVQDMDMLRQCGLYADIAFVVGDTEVMAHQAILAARGSNLGMVPDISFPEKRTQRIVISDMEPDILKELLVFLYTDKVQSDPQVAQKLLVAADKYSVFTLKERCERIICQNLCVENAAECAALALQHSCDSLLESSIHFIMVHFNEVMSTKGWHRVLFKYPLKAAIINRRVAAACLKRKRWFR